MGVDYGVIWGAGAIVLVLVILVVGLWLEDRQ
jgi:hypothetical protein